MRQNASKRKMCTQGSKYLLRIQQKEKTAAIVMDVLCKLYESVI